MRPGVDRHFTIGAISVAALAPLFALRLHQAQPGLLYPDGYQYLLMAKGIAAHGRPLLTLGPGGDTLIPNADAAAKPLFPAVVALLHAVGFGWLVAARIVSALAGAAVVVLTAWLARRLTGSWLAAVIALTACLASRELAFWGGFAGPDGLGQALALASALALLARRLRVGGVLAALAVLARPELALVVVAGATVGFARARLRQATARALVSFTIALAVLLALLRPPLGEPPLRALAFAVVGAVVAGAMFVIATHGAGEHRVPIVVGAVLAAALIVALGGLAPGIRHWVQNDWPLLLVGLGGCLFGATTRHLRRAACAIVLTAGLLTLAYVLKNPGADRYLSLLTPLVAILASLPTAAATRAQRRVALLASTSLFAASFSFGGPPALGSDGFPTIARQLRGLNAPSMPIVTAAADAYGVLLPNRPVRVARPGVRGLIIVDGAMRAYDPKLRISARVLALLDPGAGFVGPDGVIDRRPVRVEVGRVAGRARGVLASGP
jgi:4-amino-4-deoxy-L-arabinose transferase-like glycosyltransferase